MKHLLIVDDDYGARESLRTLFAPDYNITLSTNASDAKRVLETHSIDLMLLDVIMPRHTRKRICRSLAMLKDKKLENPWRKHGNIPL